MFPYINIYFYRIDLQSPRNVMHSWGDCVAVPRVGELVDLGQDGQVSNWAVEKVAWSKPAGNGGPQIVDILVSIPSTN